MFFFWNFCTGLHLSFYAGVYSSSIGFTKRMGSNRKQLVGLSGILIGVGEILGYNIKLLIWKIKIHSTFRRRFDIQYFGSKDFWQKHWLKKIKSFSSNFIRFYHKYRCIRFDIYKFTERLTIWWNNCQIIYWSQVMYKPFFLTYINISWNHDKYLHSYIQF